MNVRIDWEPGGGNSSGRQAPQGRRPATARRKNLLLLGAVGAGVLALAGALILTPGQDGPGDSGKNAAAGPTPSAGTAGANQASDAPGLPRGTASAAGRLSSRTVAGLPRGFPRTQDGAVEAAGVLAARSLDMYRMQRADRDRYQKDIYATTPLADFEESGNRWRSSRGLDDAGALTNAGGDRRYTSLCHPELGAYKLESYTPADATVTVWFPCITGLIDPNKPGGLENSWRIAQFALSWTNDDWRITSTGSGTYQDPPNPRDSGQPVTSYTERASLLQPLGTGWRLFADATAVRPAEMEEAYK
ncbi:hypothetical protein ACIPW5_39075 [Streptomyces sp. NPDC090077]|uniref:hypothetical protein n=1 Tax=Streptomyces sp. NPDC090077 TaxID=3365938 RepID=UPI00380A4E30